MNELNYFDVKLFEKEGNKIIENLKIIEKCIDRYIEYKEYLKKNIEEGEVNGRF